MDNTGNTSDGDKMPNRSDIADQGKHIVNTNDFSETGKELGLDKKLSPAEK